MDIPVPAEDTLARARSVGPLIAAAAETIERTRRIPAELADALHAARLFRMLLPRGVGGEEVAPGTYLDAVTEIARHDASVAWNVFVGNSAALIAPFLPFESARAVFADPRAVVAWGPPNEVVAHAIPGGGYRVVSGRWDFASGCRLATWMGVHCRVKEPDGGFRLNSAGRPAIRTLLFPAERARLLDTWDTLGLRGTASDSYTVEDLVVEEAFSATREEPEQRRDPGPLYAFTMQGLYAVGVAGVALGTARAMLDAFVEVATVKTPRGLGRLADDPLVQAETARSAATLGAARAWLIEILGAIHEAATPVGAIGLADRARVRLGCAHAIQAAVEVADRIHRAAGVDAIFAGQGLERRFRDIHTLSQQIQSRLSHFTAVGAILLGHKPAVFY
jgi:indole-3-acetate monooxygenase